MAESGQTKIPTFSFQNFLLQVAPNETVRIEDLWELVSRAQGHPQRAVSAPKLLPLFCSTCNGERYYEPTKKYELHGTGTLEYIQYRCRNCGQRYKVYAVWLRSDAEPPGGLAMKYGEHPRFGPIVPPDVGQLLGSDANLFQKGLDAESRGLGIGAFAYYRRVLESQRVGIFEQVIKVAQKLGADASVIDQLRAAQAERQFTASIKSLKPGPLQAIYIDGHDPLTLLYDAVSEGLHGQSDAENLASARTVRLLLADLANRIQQALADHEEVRGAVTTLLKAKAERLRKASSATGPAAEQKSEEEKK